MQIKWPFDSSYCLLSLSLSFSHSLFTHSWRGGRNKRKREGWAVQRKKYKVYDGGSKSQFRAEWWRWFSSCSLFAGRFFSTTHLFFHEQQKLCMRERNLERETWRERERESVLKEGEKRESPRHDSSLLLTNNSLNTFSCLTKRQFFSFEHFSGREKKRMKKWWKNGEEKTKEEKKMREERRCK